MSKDKRRDVFDVMEIGYDASGSRYSWRFSSRFNHRIGKLDSPGLRIRIYVSKVYVMGIHWEEGVLRREKEREIALLSTVILVTSG